MGSTLLHVPTLTADPTVHTAKVCLFVGHGCFIWMLSLEWENWYTHCHFRAILSPKFQTRSNTDLWKTYQNHIYCREDLYYQWCGPLMILFLSRSDQTNVDWTDHKTSFRFINSLTQSTACKGYIQARRVNPFELAFTLVWLVFKRSVVQ